MSDYKGFQNVKLTKPTKSTFDLSHDKRLSTRMGRLTPILCLEAVPSDYFSGSSEMLVRLAPLLAPIYDQIQVYVHYFFVPNRLLWAEWEEFITGGRLGVGVDPVTAPIPPFLDIGECLTGYSLFMGESSLIDYLGVPIFEDLPGYGGPGSYTGKNLDAMPILAYQLIWFEYYRDRNFVADDWFGADAWPAPSGEANYDMLEVQLRNYKHDYFTSALPFTQRGEEVLIPIALGGTGSIYADPIGVGKTSAVVSGIENPGATVVGYEVELENSADHPGALYIKGSDFTGTTTTINDFRSAYALQVWLERNAIGGSRYVESIQAHFGPGLAKDARLQRPEYIGGGRIPIKISEVVSTAWSDNDGNAVPLANMGGHGVTYGNTNTFKYFVPEHGFIVGILSIMNPPSYHQGLPRMFRRRSFLDYPWPTFAKLGEQEVGKAELFASAANLTEDTDGNIPLFGYQSRYADWKFVPNTSHGQYHSTLLFWTLTRQFASSPVLGETFNLFDDSVQDRIFAVNGDQDNFWIYCHNKVMVKRPLPYFGTPNTLGFV